jgi:predicted DNA-binding transcriptional regulator YafY
MEFLILIGIIWAFYAWLNSGPNETKERANSESKIDKYSLGSQTSSRARINRTNVNGKDESTRLIIVNAIEASQDLSFNYIDQEGELTARTVTPEYLETRHEDKILCLIAHCHLRDANRTFVIQRMSNLSAH